MEIETGQHKAMHREPKKVNVLKEVVGLRSLRLTLSILSFSASLCLCGKAGDFFTCSQG